MNDAPKAPAAAGAFDAATWREQLLALNPWARGLSIDEEDEAFAAARQKATIERHAQGKEAWNRWANEMLALKSALEAAGRWAAKREYFFEPPAGENEETRQWLGLAAAVFSRDTSTHTFEGEAQFADFVFPSNAGFERVTFSAVARFEGATFSAVAGFEGATFSAVAWFESATFSADAGFERATFSAGAWFQRATFSAGAWFERATFSAGAWFQGATFSAGAWFEGATFKGGTYLNNVRFDGPVNLMQAKFLGAATLDRSVFRRSASFEAIDSAAAFSLADATFHQVPNFIGATFKGTLRLDNVATPRYRLTFGWTPDKNASAHFRELKRQAVEAQDRDRELEFFAQEIRTARFHSNLPILPAWEKTYNNRRWQRQFAWMRLPSWVPRFWSWRFWFGLAYGAFSNFGRSFLRPIIVWLALVAGFAVFYLGQHEGQHQARNKPDSTSARIGAYVTTARAAWADPPKCVAPNGPLVAKTDAVREALFLSASNALVVFSLSRGDTSRRTYGCLYGFEHSGAQAPPIVPYRVAVASTLQTLMSAILIFLFLLAVRNLLRLK